MTVTMAGLAASSRISSNTVSAFQRLVWRITADAQLTHFDCESWAFFMQSTIQQRQAKFRVAGLDTRATVARLLPFALLKSLVLVVWSTLFRCPTRARDDNERLGNCILASAS